jgi:hypothetical protein
MREGLRDRLNRAAAKTELKTILSEFKDHVIMIKIMKQLDLSVQHAETIEVAKQTLDLLKMTRQFTEFQLPLASPDQLPSNHDTDRIQFFFNPFNRTDFLASQEVILSEKWDEKDTT